MKKLSMAIEKNSQTDLYVFQSKIRDLIISKNIISEEEAKQMDLTQLLTYVVIVYLPNDDYIKLCDAVAYLEALKNVS